jgi:hypothetical protein
VCAFPGNHFWYKLKLYLKSTAVLSVPIGAICTPVVFVAWKKLNTRFESLIKKNSSLKKDCFYDERHADFSGASSKMMCVFVVKIKYVEV